ncbi:MAG TPA: hypothetical protein VD905_15570 [Flavobacteriales bacterium]|nr:hypothetical protein [Flavobacteriales bacterium]
MNDLKFTRYILMLCVVSAALAFSLQRRQTYSYEFGIKLYPNGSSLITTAVLTVSDKKVVRVEIMSENQFLLELSGTVHSKANPAPDDLFFKNGIYSCSRNRDTIHYKYRKSDTAGWNSQRRRGDYKHEYIVDNKKVECPLLAELWKLRYRSDIRVKNYMYKKTLGPEYRGWAVDAFFPSVAQINYLKQRYGSDGLDNYIYGEKLYQLLKDVQDSTWIENYKNIK